MRSLRTLVPLALVSAAAALAAPAAQADHSFTVGTPQADGQRAAAQQNENREGTSDVECDRGRYVWELYIGGEHWGTYPSISSVHLGCLAPGEEPSSENAPESEWVSFGIFSPPRGWDWCPVAGRVALTGLRVAYDRYIKDFKKRCGRIRFSSGRVTVDDEGVSGEWFLERAQDDDDKKSLKCDGNRVLTGLRLGYKRDSNEYAFTSVKLLCSELEVEDHPSRSKPAPRQTPTKPSRTPTRPTKPGRPSEPGRPGVPPRPGKPRRP